MKKALALILALVMVLAMIPAAFAAGGAAYDYELKYLYDTNFWYAQDPTVENPTLGHVINFLSTNTRGTDSHGENFPYQVDLDKFVNSALGEKTAELWNIHMKYPDQMDEGLLSHWESIGLKKEAFFATEGSEINTDYFVYTPTVAPQPEAGYPLIIMNHGGGEKAYQTETFGFCEIAAREGIILVAAESTGTAQVKAVMDKVIENYPVDASRVYIVGSSMGGNAARNFAMTYVDVLAGAGIMDQPVGLASRWGAHSDEELANLAEYKLPMVWVGGTADMYGLHGTWGPDSTGEITNEFFEKNEGGEPFAVTGWNVLMKAYGIEGKDIESRLQFVDDPDANYAEYNDGYPFDNVVNLDTTGTAPRYRCTLNDTEYVTLYLVENRAHMPSGFDAEDIWSTLKGYSRDMETGKIINAKPGIAVQRASAENLNGPYGDAYKAAGYQITFTYVAAPGEDVDHVDMWGDFQWYSPEEVQKFVDNGYSGYITASSAYQYREGYLNTGYGSPIAAVSAEDNIYGAEGLYSTRNGYIFYPMNEVADGVFQLTMPIAPNQYRYAYRLYDSEGNAKQVQDPAEDVDWYVLETMNPNPAYFSYFKVGTIDEATQGQDIIWETVTDQFKGTVVEDELDCIMTGETGVKQKIQVYLPYNYDAEREEPYKLLIVSHGNTENETVYMTLGSLPTIMDNLIDEGYLTTDAVVVTVDNSLTFNGKNFGDDNKVAENYGKYVIPYMAANYGTSTETEDIAICGSSAGGRSTAATLQYFPDTAAYYGIFSIPRNNPQNLTEEQSAAMLAKYEAGGIYMGGGIIERKETSQSLSFHKYLVENMGMTDLEYDLVDGAHDFVTWHQTLENFVKFIGWTGNSAKITAAETYTAVADVPDGDVTAQITTRDGVPAFADESGVATAENGVVTIDASKISGINFNGTTDLYIGNTRIAIYVIPELTVNSKLYGSVFTNGKSTLKYSYDEKVDYGEDSKATLTLTLDGLDNALIDSSKAKVILDEGDGYFPEEYTFLATGIGAFKNGETTYALKKGDLEMDVQGYLTKDVNSGREWSCLGGDGHGNYWYNLTVDGITYNGLPVGSQTFRLHVYVYGFDYTSDANNLYTTEGTKITPVKSETGSGVAQGSEVIWTHADTPILCDWVQDDIFVTWPTGSDKSDITADDVTITLKGAYGDTKVLEAGKDYTVYASAGETQIAMSYINWSFLPVYTTMTVEVAGESKTMDVGSVYVYEAQQGGGGVTVDGTVTVYSFYGLKDVTPIANLVTYTLSANVDGATKYYAEDASGNGILVDTAADAKTFDGNGEADCNVQVIENSIYITTRRTAQYEDKTVGGETVTFTKTYSRGGMKNPSQTDTDLLETIPGYVIPYGTSNWITNEKWAWQAGVNEGWTTFHFVNEAARAGYNVTAGSTVQLELQSEVEGVKYKIVGHPTSADTTVTEDGLLHIGVDETGFCGVMAYIEGDPYAQATVTFSVKAPANAITAGSATAKCGRGETATIPATYNNADPASSVRLKINTELAIKEIDSAYSYEFNPDSNYIVVYTTEEFNKGDVLFTITFDLDVEPWLADGVYKVFLNVVDATDAEANDLELIGMPGYITIANEYLKGDINRDGKLSNADLIMIARYLVELEELDEQQLVIADYNEDGRVSNADLVLIARALVAA